MRNDLVEYLNLAPCHPNFEIGGCAEEDVVEFEQTLGVTLPSEFRLFLKSYAPCRSQGFMQFPMLEPSPGASADGTNIFQVFFGLLKTSVKRLIPDITNDFKRTYDEYIFPVDAIVIGADPGRNQIIMSLYDFSINYFDPEEERVFRVSRDFTAFIDSLVLYSYS